MTFKLQKNPKVKKNLNLYVKRVIAKHLNKFTQQVMGMRSSTNIEYLHHARVSSRRLRNALWLFKDLFPKKEWKEWRKGISRAMKTAGQARDLDIKIKYLNEWTPRVRKQSLKRGLVRLIRILRKERAAVQPRVLRSINTLEKKKIARNIRRALDKLSDEAGKQDEWKLKNIAFKRIGKRKRDLLRYKPFVDKPGRVDELHRIRIAAKHIRYCLETFEPVYGRSLKRYTDSAHKIQDLLGAMHDFDVWMQALPRYESLAGGDKEVAEAVAAFRKKCYGARTQKYRSFVSLWKRLENSKAWDKMEKDLAPR